MTVLNIVVWILFGLVCVVFIAIIAIYAHASRLEKRRHSSRFDPLVPPRLPRRRRQRP